MADEERQHKPFAEWLAIQRKGSLARELAEKMAEVNRAVLETGKSGKVVLTISVKATGDEVSVTMTDLVKATIPEADRGQSIFFVDEVGDPHRSQQVFEDPAVRPRLTGLDGGASDPADRETGEVTR